MEDCWESAFLHAFNKEYEFTTTVATAGSAFKVRLATYWAKLFTNFHGCHSSMRHLRAKEVSNLSLDHMGTTPGDCIHEILRPWLNDLKCIIFTTVML
jgi:hypothetical protein